MRCRLGCVPVLSLFAATIAAQSPTSLTEQVAKLKALEPAARVTALRSIADALLLCDDGAQRLAVTRALRQQADDGLFCSPSATEPSLLWFEFARAMRRSEVREAGNDPSALEQTLGALLAQRSGLVPMVAQMQGGRPDLHNLRSFGWHGAGEVLEAVAELAERHGEAARNAGATLAQFLAHEPVESVVNHQEGGVVGEALSPELAAGKFPIVWADGYRIALARAVLATRPPDADLSTAVLHLLYSSRRDDRLGAITRLRAAPLTAAAVPHLITRLDDGDRLVVREAITLLGSAGPVAAPAREALQKLVAGDDKERRALATRALEQIGGR